MQQDIENLQSDVAQLKQDNKFIRADLARIEEKLDDNIDDIADIFKTMMEGKAKAKKKNNIIRMQPIKE